MPWASALSLQAWDGVNQREGLLRVVTIASGQLNGERNSACVADQMALAAQLVGRAKDILFPNIRATTAVNSWQLRFESPWRFVKLNLL